MAFTRIVGLSSFLLAFRVFCKFSDRYGADIRTHVPSEHLATFDALRAAVSAFCLIERAIDYQGDGVGAS